MKRTTFITLLSLALTGASRLAVMNKHFINIKLDREERPDVDQVYMTFVQATTGAGSWPMSVWLTPDLKPFVGGTYFPPEDAHGRPGFKSVLEQLAAAWKKAEKDIRKWLPGEDWDSAAFAYRSPAVVHRVTGEAELPGDLKKGSYIIALAILDRQGGMLPSARFATVN